jgi:hypothetical protein
MEQITSKMSSSGKQTLFIGGLVAVGFDRTGALLLTVSHSDRGIRIRSPDGRFELRCATSDITVTPTND